MLVLTEANDSLKPADMSLLSDAPKVVRKMRKFEAVETKQDAADLKDVVRSPALCGGPVQQSNR